MDASLAGTDPADTDARLRLAWAEHRAALLGLALRMTGNLADAEEAVQDAYMRLAGQELDAIDDLRAWLVVVTSRRCLDRLRSAEARRTQSTADVAAAAESAATLNAGFVDVADRVTLDDRVRLALLVVLEQMSPAERVVFVLHDVFQVPFPSIADTVGRSPEACRQLASRARRRVEEAASTPRFTADAAEHARIAERFVAACAGGDLDALLRLLDPDVVGVADRGRLVRLPLRGSRRVAKRLVKLFARDRVTLIPGPDLEQPAVIAFRGRTLVGLLTFGVRGGRIDHIDALLDRRRLAPIAQRLGERR